MQRQSGQTYQLKLKIPWVPQLEVKRLWSHLDPELLEGLEFGLALALFLGLYLLVACLPSRS